jgi:23S rRNA (cytidine1920-2'-O)/16S rRNA (cytidine1409-2'-O)-methyltransferase
MSKSRLDQKLSEKGWVASRSQAESYIKLGEVKVNGRVINKPGFLVNDDDKIEMTAKQQYVSRAALKLASVADVFKLDFNGKTVLDIGSSTGGFTDYALRHGAAKVIAVEVGKNQLHPSLHGNPKIELYEQTDIRNFKTDQRIDIVVADLSFISLREILPSVVELVGGETRIIAMVKPQFEAAKGGLKHKGVIKNDKMRRDILKDFEIWAQQSFVITAKADSAVEGARGNRERFYSLKKA